MSGLISEDFRKKMARLSGVDLIEEEKKRNIELIEESNFISKEIMLEEGIKDIAIGLLATLVTLGASAQNLKPTLLSTDLKSKKQVVNFEKKLQSVLKPEQLNSPEYKKFVQHINQLQSMVGKHVVNKETHVITKYTKAKIHESDLTFDLTDSTSKSAFDALMTKAKKGSGLIISLDTLDKMVQVAQPDEQVKSDQTIQFSNQGFKSYNNYQPDQAIVDSIAEQIINTFQGYKNIYGTIEIHGSASHVPTQAFGGSNDSLAQARSCSLAQALSDKLPDNLKDKIVVTFGVDGPEYANDAADTAKYAPYQHSSVKIGLTAVKSAPIVLTPERVIVKVKYLSSNIGADTKQQLTSSLQGGKKGNLSTVCPVNFGKKKK